MHLKCERPLLRRTFLRQSGAALAASAVASFAQTNSRSRTAPQSTPSLSRQFARWAAGLKYEDLPPAVIDRAKGVTLQALSSVLLGSQMPAGQEAIKLITSEESGARNGATILVDGAKATKSGAAYANAEMAVSPMPNV